MSYAAQSGGPPYNFGNMGFCYDSDGEVVEDWLCSYDGPSGGSSGGTSSYLDKLDKAARAATAANAKTASNTKTYIILAIVGVGAIYLLNGKK